MCLQPQFPCIDHWIYPGVAPPRGLIAVAMDFAMMTAAERNSEFITDLAAQGSALSKAQVMGIAGLPAADQAGLLGDMPEVVAIPNPSELYL
jgi:hypothetical protein